MAPYLKILNFNFFFAVKTLIKNLGDRVTEMFSMFSIGADREGRK
jgi:hypothetical protein